MSVVHHVPMSATHRATVQIRFTEHALERLGERAWQVPVAGAAAVRLAQIIEHATLVSRRPAWLHPTTAAAHAWLELGDLAFPLVVDQGALVAVTCLARGELCTAEDRRARAHARRRVARVRDLARRHHERFAVTS